MIRSEDFSAIAAIEILRAQAAALTRPPLTIHDVLDALAVAGVPDFAAAIRDRL